MPSLNVMRQQLKGFAAFMADNAQFRPRGAMALQVLTDKNAKTMVFAVDHRSQQSMRSYISTAYRSI